MKRSLTVSTKKKIIKSTIWATALYESEAWTIKYEEKRRLEAMEMWIWRKM